MSFQTSSKETEATPVTEAGAADGPATENTVPSDPHPATLPRGGPTAAVVARVPEMPALDAATPAQREREESVPPLNLRTPRTSDTLLSAPTPADRADIELEDRVNDLRLRVAELQARVSRIENRPHGTRRPAGALFWLLFLFLLFLSWQILDIARK